MKTEKKTPDFKMTATTLAGLEEILAIELRDMGARNVKLAHRAVHFSGDLGTLYKVNFRSRFAIRVLKPIKSFIANSEEVFYQLAKTIPWETIIQPESTFAVHAVLHSEAFTHSGFMALRCKDAIVDCIRDKRGERPNVNVESPDVSINVHINVHDCTISLDSTGDSLHRRGYRIITGQAPLNEVLAAGMVELSGWNPNTPFVDGMCGSGTLAIEAAIKALQIPPGIFRKEPYGFERWDDFDKELMEAIVESCMTRILDRKVDIRASDMHSNVISKARKNIYNAELEDDIMSEVKEFSEVVPLPGPGTVVLNPPYGERMDKEDIDALYKRMGDTFKQNFKGYTCFILTSNLEALKSVGLRTTSRTILFNGALECRFARYDIYEGTKKVREIEEN
jgi:putative N6-adenine-specific DNA methylase